MNLEQLKEHALHVRQNSLRAVYAAQSGHPGGSLSAADILTYLFFEVMDINETNVYSLDRDRFVLSKGHITPGYYSILVEKGLLDASLLTSFRQLHSPLQGHPNMNYVKGVDMSTGSLGQGISAAVGMALANQLDNNGHRVFALLGDGECQEGQVWEATMSAAHYHLDNLTLMVDCNHLQIDGVVDEVMNVYPLKDKFAGFGLAVFEADGHDFESLKEAFDAALNVKGQPSVILCNTVKGKGVSFMENQAKWHGSAPNQELYEQAMAELGGQA